MLVNIPYICMLQGLFTSSTCCWFPFFWGGGGALGFRWKSTICRFFAGGGGGGVQGKQSCMMPYTQTNCAMKHGPHFSSAWKWEILNIANVACRDLKNIIFFWDFQTLNPPECSERSVFRSTSPDLGPANNHWNGWTFFPTHFGAESESRVLPGFGFSRVELRFL